MLEIAWVETTRDGIKIGFLSSDFFTPFLTIIGREGGSAHDWGGGESEI